MGIAFTTSTNMDEKGVRGMMLACTQPLTTAQPAGSSSALSTAKPTARFSSIREFIHWLALGLFLGCALNMNATVTDSKPSAARLEKVSLRPVLPSKVMVDGRPYLIRIVDQLWDVNGEPLDGTTDTKMAMIDIRSGQPIAEERDTVLHELLHACFDQNIRNYQHKKFTEEYSVNRITPKLLKVIRENKELMGYLTAQ